MKAPLQLQLQRVTRKSNALHLHRVEEAEGGESAEIVGIESEEGLGAVGETDCGVAGVVGAFAAGGGVLNECFPDGENLGRVGQKDEARFGSGDFRGGCVRGPAEAAGVCRARGDDPKFDQVLRADAEFATLREQARRWLKKHHKVARPYISVWQWLKKTREC